MTMHISIAMGASRVGLGISSVYGLCVSFVIDPERTQDIAGLLFEDAANFLFLMRASFRIEKWTYWK